MARASKPCPTCPALITDGRARCSTCMATKNRENARARRAAGAHWYDSKEWRRTRIAVVKGRHCADCNQPASEADHVVPRQILVAVGVHDPDHMRWCIGRCKPCHARKTRLVDDSLLRRLRAGEDPQLLAEEADATHAAYARQQAAARTPTSTRPTPDQDGNDRSTPQGEDTYRASPLASRSPTLGSAGFQRSGVTRGET